MIKGEKGQSMVEVALLLPVILLLLMGIFDVGRLIYTSMDLNEVSAEVVRIGSLGGSDSSMTQYAQEHVSVPDPTKLEVDITPDDSTRVSGNYLDVTLKYPMSFITPFISNLLSSSFTVKATATMRVE